MMSKKPSRHANALGSTLVTTTFGSPHKAMLSARTEALERITSLETRRKPFPKAIRNDAARSVLFPPGAAHKSRTLTGREQSPQIGSNSLNMLPTTIAEESWT